jgi:quercetin dioxygenase-like cupin family protein
MERKTFILSALSFFPLSAFPLIKKYFTMRTDKGFKIASGETRFGEHFKMKGVTLNILDLKVSGKDTDGGFALFEQNGLTPNGGPPLHIHPEQDEVFFVVEGEYRFQVGNDTFYGKAGDSIFMPKNVPHAFIQLSEKAKMLVLYQPAGKMEEFFKITDRWISPPSREEVNAAFEACNMKVVGPPLKRE